MKAHSSTLLLVTLALSSPTAAAICLASWSGKIGDVTVDGSGQAVSFGMDTDGDGSFDKTIPIDCNPNSLAGSLNAWAANGNTVTFDDENNDGHVDCDETLTAGTPPGGG